MTRTPSEILRRAADFIDEHGWIQGMYGTVNGPVCADGAISLAAGRDHPARMIVMGPALEACQKLADHLDLPKSDAPLDVQIAAWNDHDGRTAAQVSAAMRAAADS